jgi:hypothetical protein
LCIRERIDLRSRAKHELMFRVPSIEISRRLRDILGVTLGNDGHQCRGERFRGRT